MLSGAGWAYSLVEADLGLHGPPCGSKPGRLSTRSRCWTWPRARKLVSRNLAGESTGRRDTSLTGFAVFKYTQRTLTPCHIVGSLSLPFCLGFLQSQVVPNAPLRARPVHQQELLSLPSRNSTLLPDSEPPKRAVKRFQSPVIGYATCRKTENAAVAIAFSKLSWHMLQ